MSSKYDKILKDLKGVSIKRIQGDASERCYYRIFLKNNKSFILQDNNNNLNLLQAQLKSHDFLKKHGINVPSIIHVYKELGL